jgi:glycosyltransferase involved in cell wall biosynthesis
MPKVSVVIPTYQRAAEVARTVRDLLQQSLQDIEIIVADDGSTDGTAAEIAGIDDPRVHFAGRGHLGMPLILNEGLAAATGEYVMTCHDHDVYDHELLRELAGALDRHPSALYAHCGVMLTDPTGATELVQQMNDFPELLPGRVFLRDHLVPGLDSKVSALTMVRGSALREGLLKPEFGEVADVEMWLHLASIGDVAYVRKPLIRVKQRDNTSMFYTMGYRLLEKTLRAKREYIGFIDDDRRRSEVVRTWRRQIDSSAFREMLVALEDGRPQDLRPIAEFAQREGTRTGAFVTASFARTPAPVTRAALSFMRRLARRAQSRQHEAVH